MVDECIVVRMDPLHVSGWDEQVGRLPGSTFFHGSAWAKVLSETYGHRPGYFCGQEQGRITAVLPVMEVANRWTGKRGVSLPFTDFCGVAADEGVPEGALYQAAMEYGRAQGWRYLECRGGTEHWASAKESVGYYSHTIELGDEAAVFERMDSAVRRAVRKALKSGVTVQFREDLEAMSTYYGLHCRTRKRHGLPPQPWKFFAAIGRRVCEAKQGFVALAMNAGNPLAGAVIFRKGAQAVFKFGASDYRMQELRGNDLVMWEVMKRLAKEGVLLLNLGRTSLANLGLRQFKLGLGAREERIGYHRYDFGKHAFVTSRDRSEMWLNRVFRALPVPVLRLAGGLIYPAMS
jgi:hypothetical protein